MELDDEAASPGTITPPASTTKPRPSADDPAAGGQAPAPVQPAAADAHPSDVDAVPAGETGAETCAAAASPRRSARETVSAKEQQQIDAAVRASEAELKKRPLIVITPEQQRSYAEHVRQQLQSRHRQLRIVPGKGDCILASALLGCEAAGIDVCAEQAAIASPAHASHLRVFLAAWIREHRQVLFDLSGGDESWRGEALTIRKLRRGGISCRPSRTGLTLDGCLDLFADTSERKWDILWASTEPGALQTNLGDYLPQLLACALNIRLVLIKAIGAPEVVGARDSAQLLTAEPSREVVVVQSVRQDHWDAALPLAAPLAAMSDSHDAAPSVVAVAPGTPISTPHEHSASAASTPSSECAASSHVRRRIFADPPSAAMIQLETDLAAAQHQHAEQMKQIQQQHEAQLLQLRQHYAAEKERAEDEQTHTIAHAVETTARTMHDIERLTCALMTVNQDHRARVRDPSVGDAVAETLKQLLIVQAAASCPLPFLGATHRDLQQWTSDLELIEAALGRPFHPYEPAPVDHNGAQQVCELMTQWLTQLDDASVTLSFLDLLLLTKKLLCMDQLRPDTPKGSHFSLFEVHSLTSRLLAHARVWSHVVRVPLSYFDSAPAHLARRSARYYVNAVKAATAAHDVQQRVRLVVEQCKVLASVALLQEARKLTGEPQYPSAPFDTLQALHTHYPAAGPPLDLSIMQQLDAELDAWRTQLEAARLHAAQLEQEDVVEVGAQQLARAKVDELAAAAPRTFEQRMNQSQLFFHPDKRRQDTATSAEEKTAQFSKVKAAWAALAACRGLFQELRTFKHRRAAAAEAAQGEEAEADAEEQNEQ